MALPPDTAESFVREVDENLRRDQMAERAKRYGGIVAVAVVLFLLAVAGYLYWQHNQRLEAEAGTEQLATALQDIGSDKMDTAPAQLDALRQSTDVQIVCEPRHPSWFDEGADAMLAERKIARVAADPAPVPAAAVPGGWPGFAYWRLHGSPQVYRSPYEAERIAGYAGAMRAVGTDAWCMFDNTASSAATGNALELSEMLGLIPVS